MYNRYLSKHFHFQKVESWLEVPLDSAVAKGLKRKAGRGGLPQWPGLKHLRPDVSDTFQEFASQVARQHDIARVHLDVYLWLENR